MQHITLTPKFLPIFWSYPIDYIGLTRSNINNKTMIFRPFKLKNKLVKLLNVNKININTLNNSNLLFKCHLFQK